MVFIGGIQNFAYLTVEEYQHIVRIVGNDIPGEKKVIVGLTQIKGIGNMFANTILNLLKISHNSSIGYLTDEQVKSIEKIITDPSASNFPTWFLSETRILALLL